MASPNEKLANALSALKKLQAKSSVIKSSDLKRFDREILVSGGFIAPILTGWYMASRPEEKSGSTTQWYASIREFLARYCNDRFSDEWCASPEYSVAITTGSSVSPKQFIIHTPKGSNAITLLPHGYSLLAYKTAIDPNDIDIVSGIRVFKLDAAITRLGETYYKTNPTDAKLALLGIKDVSDVLTPLLQEGKSMIAGRVAGAYRAVGKPDYADTILNSLRSAGYRCFESNPFELASNLSSQLREESPYAMRIRLMWSEMRQDVIDVFGDTDPGLPTDLERCMQAIEDVYVTDAYHSLSIEGYKVTDELIERVRSGDWDPESTDNDNQSKDAMAARGYWQAHNAVKESIKKMLTTQSSPGKVFKHDHGSWYRELFAPSVQAGILKPEHLAGYRGSQVFIRNAEHVPPPKEAVRDMMPALSELLENEPSAAVRAVLGHFMFVFIHPYMDGNGRTARFTMNAMMVSGGYPWTVIRLEGRDDYMKSLNEASARQNIKPFVEHLYSSMKDGLAAKPRKP